MASRQIPLGIGRMPLSLPLLLLWLWLGLAGRWLAGQVPGRVGSRRTHSSGLADWVYTAPSLLALGGVVILGGSLDLNDIVRAQGRAIPYAIYQPMGLAVFSVSSLMVSRCLAWTESCRRMGISGASLSLGGGPFSLFRLSGYLYLVVTGGLIATVYGAGGLGPWASGPHWLLSKTVVATLLLLWLHRGPLAYLDARLGSRLWPVLTWLGLCNTLLTCLVVTWIPQW